jgi:ATP-dependent Clp protease ATP-binding subunit ClpB
MKHDFNLRSFQMIRLMSKKFIPLASTCVTFGAGYMLYTCLRPKEMRLYSQPVKPISMLSQHIKANDLRRLKSELSSDSKDLVNQRHEGGWNLLHMAVACENFDAAKFLLSVGADVNAQDSVPDFLKQTTDMERKAPKGHHSAVTKYYQVRDNEFSPLISPYADVDGFTPLHYAVIIGSEKLVTLLLEHGADPSLTDSHGHWPKDYYDPRAQDENILRLLEDGEKMYQERALKEEREQRRKFPLEKRLKQALVGQIGPIESVASAVRRKENGWADNDRPLVFLFLGSSGIGKTELAKQLANYIHKGDRDGFVRIDMSEYQQKHEVAKFIGAPPGYVGYGEGGQLTEKLKKKPNAVVLLDEVEKAHVDVLTIMLQVFDEGRLTDGQGNTVDCKDAIFVMTSNLAQQEIAQESSILRDEQGTDKTLSSSEDSMSRKFINETIYPILRRHFQRDEFLGRINEVLFFLPFTKPELAEIVEKELVKWQKRAQDTHKIKLTWTQDVVDKVTEGYNIQYGARSIIHEVEKKIVNQIAQSYEMEEVSEGGIIEFHVEDGKVKLVVKQAKQKSGFLW